MNINGKTARIINSVISYESGISWKVANKRMEAIDYGLETDHLSAKISIWGDENEVMEFRNAIPPISSEPKITFSKGENPFGPAFDHEESSKYLLISMDDIMTTGKGIAQMSFQIVASTKKLTFAHEAIPFNLANFAVQKVKRESEESNYIIQNENGWSAFRHGWNRPEFTLSLLAKSQIMGGSIRWLLTDSDRTTPISINCNRSMVLVDSQTEEAFCTSFGNLHRFGNSGMWQADFNFVRAA